jgi:hypothetical protein
MASRWSRFTRGGPSRLLGHTRDTTALLRDYLLQETVDPIRTLGRYVLWGTLGSFFVGLGTLMLLVGLLRLLQGETGAFHGNLSWVPYVIVTLVAISVIAATILRIITGPARRRRPVAKAAK